LGQLLLFGVRSPLTPDYEETCARLGLTIAGAVQVDGLAPRVLERELLVALTELTQNHRRAPYVTCAFNPARRAALATMAEGAGLHPAEALVDPSAVVARSVRVGEGSFVNAGVVIGAAGVVGDHVVVNRAANLGHHVVIGDFVSIGPGVTIAGNVWIGENSMIGAGAVLLPGIRVGADVTVAAGSVVRRNLPDSALAAGNPAVVKPFRPRAGAFADPNEE
jgi:hypothetical protein